MAGLGPVATEFRTRPGLTEGEISVRGPAEGVEARGLGATLIRPPFI